MKLKSKNSVFKIISIAFMCLHGLSHATTEQAIIAATWEVFTRQQYSGFKKGSEFVKFIKCYILGYERPLEETIQRDKSKLVDVLYNLRGSGIERHDIKTTLDSILAKIACTMQSENDVNFWHYAKVLGYVAPEIFPELF